MSNFLSIDQWHLLENILCFIAGECRGSINIDQWTNYWKWICWESYYSINCTYHQISWRSLFANWILMDICIYQYWNWRKRESLFNCIKKPIITKITKWQKLILTSCLVLLILLTRSFKKNGIFMITIS